MDLRLELCPHRFERRHNRGPHRSNSDAEVPMWECKSGTVKLACVQAAAVRKALHGWLYLIPFEPQTLSVRQFKAEVRNATERNFDVKLGDAPIDSAAVALYDAIMLWARAASRVLARQGAGAELQRGRAASVAMRRQLCRRLQKWIAVVWRCYENRVPRCSSTARRAVGRTDVTRLACGSCWIGE